MIPWCWCGCEWRDCGETANTVCIGLVTLTLAEITLSCVATRHSSLSRWAPGKWVVTCIGKMRQQTRDDSRRFDTVLQASSFLTV